jgi:predicted permease
MFKNYFKTAWRNVVRNKAFSAINIVSLAVGIAASLIIFTVVRYELSYDRFQPNYKNIYRIVTEDKYSDGSITTNPAVPGAALEALRTKMPDVLFAGINSGYGSQVTVNNGVNKKFIEPAGIFFCEPQFFKIFSFTWLVGNASVLNEPNTVVLSMTMAAKYFGNWQQALNKTITLDNAIPLKVGGIIKDAPLNSDFPLETIMSFKTLKDGGYQYHNDWNNLSSNFQVYALLPQNADIKSFTDRLNSFDQEHYKGQSASTRTSIAQPLSELHFDRRFDIYGNHITNKSTLITLSLIGIFIIIMACINFINLATAQAIGRSKEIGIRKVLGSGRAQLFLQVIGETGLIVLFAIILASVIARLCLPYVKNIASIQENLSLLNAQTFLFMALLLALMTILSGLYPALIISGYNPSLALKNKITSANIGGISLRRGLVVLQFSISQILLIGTIVAISQMNFVNQADLGFNKEALLLISANTDSVILSKMPAFKQQLLSLHSVKSVSFTSDAPSSDNNWSTNFAFNHKADEPYQVSLKFGDEDYLKTFELQLAAGRFYNKSDTMNEVVINETLLHKLSLKNPQEAIGKDIRLGGQRWKKVVGVVKDFKDHSLKKAVAPILLAENHTAYWVIAVKINSHNIPQAQAAIQKVWDGFFPEYAYTSSFMDENIAKFYEQEEQLELLYKIFAGIAIFISCLGLYGLVSFMAAQKTKETGIRKVLGASVMNIVYLFSKEFTILILTAFAIAVPVGYYMMNSWLANFAFRIKISIWIFALAILASVVIAWITVGYKAIKAAVANPVKSLRTE